jgi:hypothetical protein
MSPTIRVSRQGFTTCPSCKAHVRVERPIAQARCFFCSQPIVGPGDTVSGSALARVAAVGRGGLIAASLVGFGALGACGEPQPTQDVGTQFDVAPDLQNAPLYGLPADMIVDPGINQDTQEADTNSTPKDVSGPDAEASDILEDIGQELPQDIVVAPVYGLPADVGPSEADVAPGDTHAPDTSSEDVKEADAPVPQPLYGLPPTPPE